MNKSLLLIIAIGFIFITGGIYVATTSQKTADKPSVVETNKSEDNPKSNNDIVSKPSYIQITSDQLANTKNSKRVLFFHAPWCPTCKSLDKEILSSISNIPADITIIRVDFDSELDLRKKYGVTVQHTLVQIDADGNAITKWSGSNNLVNLLAKVQ